MPARRTPRPVRSSLVRAPSYSLLAGVLLLAVVPGAAVELRDVSDLETVAAGEDGRILGTVTDPGGVVVGARVSACSQSIIRCQHTTTSGSGQYAFSELGDDNFDVYVSPPTGSTVSPAQLTVQSLFFAPAHTVVRDFTLSAPVPLPAGVAVNGRTSGVPEVFHSDTWPLSVTGCPGGSGHYIIEAPRTNTTTGSLIESLPGVFTATVGPLDQQHGAAEMTVQVTGCSTPSADRSASFTLHVTASSLVRDTTGAPIAGATIAIWADSATGLGQVPAESALLAPWSRTNPVVSGADGRFGWDTAPGGFFPRASKEHCYAQGSFDPVAGTVVPFDFGPGAFVPAQIPTFTVVLDCRNIPPVIKSANVSASVIAVGRAVTFTAAAVDPNGAVSSYQWDFGDGTGATGAIVTHAYAAAGQWAPTVRVTDDQGGSSVAGAGAVTVQPVSAFSARMTAPGNVTLGTTARVAWASAAGAGVASYDMRYRRAAWNAALGSYVLPASWQRTSSTSATQPIANGALYCFSSRARDVTGTVSDWSAERCTAKPLDDRALAVKGNWSKTKGKAYFAGTISKATTRGATLTRARALPGRVALVVSKGKHFGKVGVYYNGKRVAKVRLAKAKPLNEVVVPLPRLTKKGTITIRVLTSGRTVRIDGLLTARV